MFDTTPQAAEVERERLTSLINSMADGVIAVDRAAKIVNWGLVHIMWQG